MYKALGVSQVELGPTSPSRPLKGVDTISPCISRVSTLFPLLALHALWTLLATPVCANALNLIAPPHASVSTQLPMCAPVSQAKTVLRALACRPRLLPRVLSVPSCHGPGIDASTGKARCVLSVPPCAYALVCIGVVIATPCHDTDTYIVHAHVHASACTHAYACACACACPRVCACTLRRCMACPLDAAHSFCDVAVAPCLDALDFGPQTCVP
ncbi:hypothetical protein SLEP1_g57418 [Rubroshorea leprosula]|uniref:Uncharacterized protein n=1 Tax=Rubroshorea leprosula TaxID=152421 RepID=A0AAV5MMF6_9ROSI|nr:hypothetical protein SLEP1_g57418 [Rubroshorea leprosula]